MTAPATESPLFDELNPTQREAVAVTDGPLLVVVRKSDSELARLALASGAACVAWQGKDRAADLVLAGDIVIIGRVADKDAARSATDARSATRMTDLIVAPPSVS